MIPIAHRGLWWPDKAKQNTPQAIEEAVSFGFGVEIDVWAMPDGGLGVGHNSSTHNVRDFSALKDAPLIAWNVKNKLCFLPLLEHIVSIRAYHQSFIFDFELVGEEWNSPLAVSRLSDKETSKKERDGYWMDCFEREWRTKEAVHEAVVEQGKKAYLVSPELHGKPILLKQWGDWREAHGICTDAPHLLQSLMNTEWGLFPEKQWWT